MAYSPYFSSWAKGELSPQLFGRADVEQYGTAAAELTNCLVRPYGNVLNRPGTQFLCETKFQDKDTRLLEFVFSETDAFAIEFGEEYFRFFTNSAKVLIGSPPAWVTATPYVVGDFVTESGFKYYCISAHTSGVFATDLAFPRWLLQDVYEVPHIYQEADLRAVQYVQNKDVIFFVHPDYPTHKLSRFAPDDWVFEEVDFVGGPFLDDNTETSFTLTASAVTGSITVTAIGHAPFLAGHVGSYWKIGGTVGAPPNDIQGYVIITAFTSTTVVSADVIETLSTAVATDDWAEGAWSDVRGYPSTITFDKRRLALGATTFEPQKLWESKPFIYDDFTVGDLDDDAINIEISSDQSNTFRWLSPGNVLAVGTFGGEFVVSSGTQGETLTPSNVNAQPQSSWGSEAIQPRRISTYTYYVQRGGRKIRELYYYWDLDTFKSVDVTIYSEHITESGIVELIYQVNPDSIVYALRADGKIACMTRETDQLIQAWTLIETDGEYRSLASIPHFEEPYDQVWCIVDRFIDGTQKKYVEFFHNQIAPDEQQQAFYVDSGLCFDAYALTDGISLTLTALTGAVTVTAGSAYFSVGMVGKRIKAYVDGVVVGDLDITGFVSTTIVTGTVTLAFSSLTYTGGQWGVSVTTLSGIDHLEGEEIVMLADGGVENWDNRLTVTAGAITLNSDYFYVCVGLPYEAYLTTLPLEFGAGKTGTAIGQKKRINQIGAKVDRSLGMEYGRNKVATNLFKFATRSVATFLGTPEPFYTGEYNGQLFQGSADYLGQITIAQRRPLPMNLLAIMPIEVTFNK
jgi:hypothetical protein